MLWSILISGIPERYNTAQPLLYSLLEAQGVSRMSEVELIYLMDNKRRTVGAKRNALLDVACGEYITFIDDDDQVAPNYVQSIYKAIAHTRRQDEPADVICFPQRAILLPHGATHECEYSLEYWKRPPGERRQLTQIIQEDGTPRRDAMRWTGPPAHTMCWRAGIAKAVQFPSQQFGEDVDWVDKACALAVS